jgi:hypothetical protein
VVPHRLGSTKAPAGFQELGEPATGSFGTLGIAAAHHADQIGHGIKRMSERLLHADPSVNRLANYFRRGELFPARNTRNALARFVIEA